MEKRLTRTILCWGEWNGINICFIAIQFMLKSERLLLAIVMYAGLLLAVLIFCFSMKRLAKQFIDIPLSYILTSLPHLSGNFKLFYCIVFDIWPNDYTFLQSHQCVCAVFYSKRIKYNGIGTKNFPKTEEKVFRKSWEKLGCLFEWPWPHSIISFGLGWCRSG